MTTKALAKSTLRVVARNAVLNAKAQAAGWANYSAYSTAILQGSVKMVECGATPESEAYDALKRAGPDAARNAIKRYNTQRYTELQT